MQRIQKETREQLEKAQERQKANADRYRRDQDFEVGDQVRLAASEINPDAKLRSHKLGPQWYGPFVVLAKEGNTCYKLKLPRRLKVHDVFHTSVLLPYNEDKVNPERQPKVTAPVEAAPELREQLTEFQDQGAEWVVEAILDFRIWNNTKQWLTKYEGYPRAQASWQPQESFINTVSDEITECFQQYTDQYPLQLRNDTKWWKKRLGNTTFSTWINRNS